jgi:hypothetical protein
MAIDHRQLATLYRLVWTDEVLSRHLLIQSELGALLETIARCPTAIEGFMVETATGQSFVGREMVSALASVFPGHR